VAILPFLTSINGKKQLKMSSPGNMYVLVKHL